MATIKYLLQSNSESAPIYLRLSLGRGNSLKRKTGLSINPKKWSRATGLPKQNYSDEKNITSDLRKLKSFILDEVNDAKRKGVPITGDWLIHKIDLKFQRIEEISINQNVSYWINYIIDNAHLRENAKGGYGLSRSRINSYKGLLNSVNEFQGNKEIKILDLDKKKFNEFKKWLFDFKKYNPTTAIKKLTDLQKVVREARENNVPIATDFDKVKFKKVSPYDDDMDVITLTMDDIEKIEKTDLTNEALINARKWLILSCFTGQRGKDLLTRVVESNFKKYGSDLVIKFKQEKSNKMVSIPVLPKVKEIYESGLPYIISVQKLNKHIKSVCKIAKIDNLVLGKLQDKQTKRHTKKLRPKYEYITSHTGRRTFATIHYKKLLTPIIMRVTGHTKESTFLGYINQSQDDHIEPFLEYYKTKELKERKEPQLNIIKNGTD
jgi:integrase